MILPLDLGKQSYDIVIERGVLSRLSSVLSLERKVMVITDDGVPEKYVKAVASQSKNAYIITVAHGEQSKNFENYKLLLSALIENSFTRSDCIAAVGGGVVGDLGGFAAASYMRGIDFYNIPTTLLSQVDSSIGGKTAINFGGIKNIVGAFYQPKKVVIDSDTLNTLDIRQLRAGLAEAVKMAATSDKELFGIIEKSKNIYSDIDTIIERSLRIKKDIVEKDPTEKGLRKVLNFGHTIGHAIESLEGGRLLHGECVSLGMLPMCSENARVRLMSVLEKHLLPVSVNADKNKLFELITHDKKTDGDYITVVYVSEIGSFEMRKIKLCEVKKYIGEVL